MRTNQPMVIDSGRSAKRVLVEFCGLRLTLFPGYPDVRTVRIRGEVTTPCRRCGRHSHGRCWNRQRSHGYRRSRATRTLHDQGQTMTDRETVFDVQWALYGSTPGEDGHSLLGHSTGSRCSSPSVLHCPAATTTSGCSSRSRTPECGGATSETRSEATPPDTGREWVCRLVGSLSFPGV